MIDSEPVKVEAFHVNGIGKWELSEYKTMEDMLLHPVEISVPLAEIYEGTKLMG